MTKKSEFLRIVGFKLEAERLENGLCPICGEPVTAADMTNEEDLAEYKISGMCAKCQREIFEDGADL